MNIPAEIIQDFEINVKKVVDGLLVGKFRSKNLGGSPEFAGHRPYVEGDDIRRIDWRVFARKQRLYTKLFTSETEAPLILIYDDSQSMKMWNKDRTSSLIAGTLLYVSNRMNARFGLFTLSGAYVPLDKGYSHLLRCYYTLQSGKSKGSDFLKSVLTLLSNINKRLIFTVISDFAFDYQMIQKGLNLLARYGDLVVIQVMSGEEWNFKYDGKTLVDAETKERVRIPPNSKDLQRERIRNWAKGVRNLTFQVGGRYALIFSDAPFHKEVLKVMEIMEAV